MKTIRINEVTIRHIVAESIKNILTKVITLNETKNNLDYSTLIKDMKVLGFEKRKNGEGSSEMWWIPSYGEKSIVTLHTHNANAKIPADFLKEVKDKLIEIGWFKSVENFNKFPFEKWDMLPYKRRLMGCVDTTEQNIADANEKYKDASVNPVFPEKNSVCVLTTKDGCNLCRSKEDMRPLLPDWYGRFQYDKTGKIPCLKIDNWVTCQTEAYPIKKDGTLGELIIENKKYGKSVTRMRKR